MISVLIVEDEETAASRLERLLAESSPAITVDQVTKTVRETVHYLQLHKPDLIFMDINLFEQDSFAVFDEVDVKTPIVFVTAYSDYAIKAFEQNSIDYLLKPYTKEALQRSLNKFYDINKQRLPDYAALSQSDHNFKTRFLIKLNNKFIIIPTEEVAYVYFENKTSFLYDFQGRKYPCDEAMGNLELVLNPKHFFRINRQLMINIKAIQDVSQFMKSRMEVTLKPPLKGKNTAVAIEKTGAFKRWIAG